MYAKEVDFGIDFLPFESPAGYAGVEDFCTFLTVHFSYVTTIRLRSKRVKVV